ncbi:CvpA family protein [Clostridium tepidiprofundi]|uniref:CvpA family protein n=1 Tax=Clostridium tepidiprofundi TaxID=420412 RepID=UPI00082D09B1|nr:CvpA family protein [Clostridium tepidiprofundi]
MNTIDIIIISIVVIGALFGLIRGFMLSLFSFASYIVAVVCIKMYSGRLANFFAANTTILNRVTDFVAGKLSSMAVPSSSIPASNTVFPTSNKNMGIFSFVEDTIKSGLTSGEHTIAEFLVHIILITISAILIFVAVKTVFALIGLLINSLLKKSSILNAMNRILGMLLGIVTSTIIIAFIIMIVTPFVFMTPDSYIAQMFNKSIILVYIYKSGMISNILNGILLK